MFSLQPPRHISTLPRSVGSLRRRHTSGVGAKPKCRHRSTDAIDPFSEVECASQRQTINTCHFNSNDLVIGGEQAGRDGEDRVCSSSDMLDELPWSNLAARRSHSAIANRSHLVGCAAIAQGSPSTPSFRALGLQ